MDSSTSTTMRQHQLPKTKKMKSLLSGGGHEGSSVLCLAHKDSATLSSGGEDGRVVLWDLRQSLPTAKLSLADEVPSLAFYGSERLLAASGESVQGFDLRHLAAPVLQLPSLDDAANDLSLSAKQELLAVATDSGTVQVFQLPGGTPFKRLRGHESVAFVARFHPKKPWDLVSGGFDGKLIFWDVARGSVKAAHDFITADNCSFNPPYVLSADWKGSTLALGLNNGDIAFFDVKRKSRTLKRVDEALHRQGVTQVSFADSEERLVSAGNDGVVSLWRVGHSATESLTHLHHGAKVNALLCLGSKQLVVGDVGSDIAVYDLA